MVGCRYEPHKDLLQGSRMSPLCADMSSLNKQSVRARPWYHTCAPNMVSNVQAVLCGQTHQILSYLQMLEARQTQMWDVTGANAAFWDAIVRPWVMAPVLH